MDTLKQLFDRLNTTAIWGTEVVAIDQPNALGDTPLHVTAAWGDLQGTQLLLDAGADVNARGEDGDTPLYSALLGNNPAVLELLLKRGADRAIINETGWSLLESAVEDKCDPRIIELLAANGDKVGPG